MWSCVVGFLVLSLSWFRVVREIESLELAQRFCCCVCSWGGEAGCATLFYFSLVCILLVISFNCKGCCCVYYQVLILGHRMCTMAHAKGKLSGFPKLIIADVSESWNRFLTKFDTIIERKTLDACTHGGSSSQTRKQKVDKHTAKRIKLLVLLKSVGQEAVMPML